MLEIFEILITVLLAGYIMMPLTRNYKDSLIISGLSIVLHELAHKFTAMAFGLTAIYHANYYGLFLGILFKYLGMPIFFVPAYVSIYGTGPWYVFSLISLAGPLTNLGLFAIFSFIKKETELIESLKMINLWLGIINLIPFPGSDGFNALISLVIRR